MAIAVVDSFKIIKIKIKQRQWLSGLFLYKLINIPSVVQAGKKISVGIFDDHLLV